MKAVLLVAAIVLAGCSSAADEPAQVIIISGETSDTPTTPAVPTGKQKGHIAGHVVDDAVRPIKNATVHLASLDLKDTSDRNGAFEFVDLPAGSYLLKFNASGHQDAQAVLEVKAGEFTRALVKLHRIPPPEPLVDVIKFEGFADATLPLGGTTALTCDCSFPFQQDLTGLQALVIEAAMDGAGQRGFYAQLRTAECCATIHAADLPNPLWTEVDGRQIHDTSLRLNVYPWTSPMPETNVGFEVFVSSFHNMQVPAGYTAFG